MTTPADDREAFERIHLVQEISAKRYADGDHRYVDPRVQIEWQLWQLAWKSCLSTERARILEPNASGDLTAPAFGAVRRPSGETER